MKPENVFVLLGFMDPGVKKVVAETGNTAVLHK